MQDLKLTWEDLINAVSLIITLKKFSEGTYNEDWDEGARNYTEYSIDARVKYELSEREIESLGENMQLDAIVFIRNKDLDAKGITLVPQDRFNINAVDYRITKMQSKIVAGQDVGFILGVREVM